MSLTELRKRLTEVDHELIRVVAARQSIVAEIGQHKIETGAPTRDYQREREVIKMAEEDAAGLGLDPQVAAEIMGLLIRSSLTASGAVRSRRGDERCRPQSTDHRWRRQDGHLVRRVSEFAGLRSGDRRSSRAA